MRRGESVSVRWNEGSSACVAHLQGEVDLAVVPEVRETVRGVLDRGCASIVLDLGDVTYIDSTMLGLLVWLSHEVKPMGGRVVLSGANDDVARILELSGLLSLASAVGTSASVEAALAGLELQAPPGPRLWEESFSEPAKPELLRSMRARLDELLGRLALTEPQRFDIKVAVGEAITNAMMHGSPSGAESVVTVQVAAHEDRVVVRVSDSGEGFESAEQHADEQGLTGRGVKMMRALMDRVEFSGGDGSGTTVTLSEHLTR